MCPARCRGRTIARMQRQRERNSEWRWLKLMHAWQLWTMTDKGRLLKDGTNMKQCIARSGSPHDDIILLVTSTAWYYLYLVLWCHCFGSTCVSHTNQVLYSLEDRNDVSSKPQPAETVSSFHTWLTPNIVAGYYYLPLLYCTSSLLHAACSSPRRTCSMKDLIREPSMIYLGAIHRKRAVWHTS